MCIELHPCSRNHSRRSLVRHEVALHPSGEGLCGVGEDGGPAQDGLLVEGADCVRGGGQDALGVAAAAAAAELQLVVLHLQLVDERLQA